MVSVAGTGSGTLFAVVNAGWFGTLVGFVLFIIATIISVALYRRSKPIAQLRFALADEALVNSVNATEPGRLEFRYDGKVVPRVTSTSVGIWNAGTTTFRRDDVVASDALRLMLPSDGTSAFLQGSVEATSREVNDVKIGVSQTNAVFIDFDFLDPGDGFRLRLIHSGSPGAMEIAGTIRGLPQGLTSQLKPTNQKFTLSLQVMFGLVIFGATIAGVATEIAAMTGPQMIGVGISVIVVGLSTAALVYISRRKASGRIKGIPLAISEDDVLYSRLTGPAD